VGAVVLCKIPNTNTTTTITADNLALIRVDDNVVDCATVGIATLNRAATGLPDLNSTILGTSNHPFSLAVECYTRNVTSMALEGEERVGVGRFDVVKLDSMMACSG